ncbi:hypothetical protein HZC30_04335 [Candidatus Woesearchaeota archaeon]|nr:hypothetical protein [Candidatus Woesearchaeota archaeon]
MTLRHLIFGASLAAIAAGCATPNVNLRNTSTLSTPAQTQPDEEQVRVNAYWEDIDKRAATFGSAIMQDITDGRIKIKLESLPKEVEHLNATYQPKSAQNGAKITLQCQPLHNKCFTDALEHEIGHHLYQSLSEAQRANVDQAINRRLQEPDAQDFQEEIAQIDKRYAKLAGILSQQVIPIAQCSKLLKDLSLGENALEELKAAGIEYSPALAADLKATGAKYSSYMPDCTLENLSTAQNGISSIQKKVEILTQQVDKIYHHKTNSSPELPEVEITTTSIQPIAHGLDFLKAERAYFNTLDALIEERMNSGTIMEDSEAYQAIVNLSTGIVLYQVYQGTSMLSTRFSELNYSIGGHDSRQEEQFSAVIDSLVDGYSGSITTGPMKLPLDEPLLQALEPLEYNGEKVLAPLVERYRKQLQSEVK